MLAMFLFYFIFSITIVWSIYKLVQVRLSPLSNIPGYTLYNPIFGNVLFLGSKSIFERWQLNYKKFGMIYRWYTFMGNTFITITSPEYIKHVLVTNSKNYVRQGLVGADIFKKIVGKHSMLLIDGDEHKNHRSIVSPAFRIANLRKLLPIMRESARKLCNHLDGMMDCQEMKFLKDVDIRLHLSHVTLTVIGLAGFGHDFDCIDKPNRLAENISGLTVAKPGQTIITMLPYAYMYPIPAVKAIWEALRNVHCIIEDLIRSKKKAKTNQSQYADKDLLDMILERTDDQGVNDQSIDTKSTDPKAVLSHVELRDEVMTFIMAGHETSSLALTWTMAMICLRDHWQEKCRDEINMVIEDERDITWDHLDQLKLTRAVVHETMRLWSPVPAVLRNTQADDYIGPYKIPAKTNVVVLIGQMHRLADYWSEPSEFKPERFLEDDVPWDAFMPFGDGAHKCLGYQFAMAEILTVLSILLKKYRFRLAIDWTKQDVQGYVTLQPVTPILVDIIPL